jgi:prepilin-type N-terminal cleavage/methylation domain-containing protein
MRPGFRASLYTGFTLIELSIVLVIIGLLVGGVLVGTELIRSANYRAVISQVESFNAAVGAFRTKFGCLPGDCEKAYDVGLGDTDGDGDGYVGCKDPRYMQNCVDSATFIQSQTTGEYVNFWYHLNRANLITGNFSAYDNTNTTQAAGIVSPASRIEPFAQSSGIRGGWAIRGGAISTTFTKIPHNFVLAQYAVVNKTDYSFIRASDTYAIDSKMDDGLPLTGQVVAVGSMGTNGAYPYAQTLSALGGAGGPNTNWCVNTSISPSQYNVQTTKSSPSTLACGPFIKASF